MSVSSFVSRNKTAVIAATAVVAVSAGVGAYYVYNSSPKPATAESGAGSSGSAKHKKKKKKAKAAANGSGGTGANGSEKSSTGGSQDAGSVAGFPVKKDGDGPEYPVVKNWDEVKKLPAAQLKELSLKFKTAGNSAFAAKDYEKAIEFYTDAIKCDDKDPVFYSNRAACYSFLKEYQKVIDDTTIALKLKPDYIKSFSRRAVAYEKLGNFVDAIFDFTAACILGNFEDKNLNMAVDRVLKLEAERIYKEKYANRDPALPSASSVRAYLGSFRKQDLPESVTNATEGTGDYSLKLAFDAVEQGTYESFEQAQDLFNKAIEEDKPLTNKALALEFRSTFRFLANDLEGAAKDIEEALKLEHTVRRYIKRSAVFMESGVLELAKSDFATALTLDSKSPDLYYHRAQVAFLNGDFNAAIDDFKQSIALDNDFMYAHIQLAVTQYRSQSAQDALESFRKLLTQFADSSEVHTYFGEILLDQGAINEAIKEFDTAIRIESSRSAGTVNVLPLINKALALFQKTQDLNAAEDVCRKAVALDPLSDVAVSTLAQFCLQQNKTQEALDLFVRNAELARSETETVQCLAYAEAARTQLRIIKERPDLRAKLDQIAAAGPRQ